MQAFFSDQKRILPQSTNILSTSIRHQVNISGGSLMRSYTRDYNIAQKLDQKFDELLELKSKEFLKKIAEIEVPIDYVGDAERIVKDLLKLNEDKTILWLINMTGLFIDKPYYLIQILRILSNIRDFSPKNRNALDLSVRALLSSSNFEVCELSVRFFENKGDKGSIKYLQSMRPSGIKWFDKYVADVIEDLSEEC